MGTADRREQRRRKREKNLFIEIFNDQKLNFK